MVLLLGDVHPFKYAIQRSRLICWRKFDGYEISAGRKLLYVELFNVSYTTVIKLSYMHQLAQCICYLHSYMSRLWHPEVDFRNGRCRIGKEHNITCSKKVDGVCMARSFYTGLQKTIGQIDKWFRKGFDNAHFTYTPIEPIVPASGRSTCNICYGWTYRLAKRIMSKQKSDRC